MRKLPTNIQGDHSGCAKPPVDIKTKAHALKQNMMSTRTAQPEWSLCTRTRVLAPPLKGCACKAATLNSIPQNRNHSRSSDDPILEPACVRRRLQRGGRRRGWRGRDDGARRLEGRRRGQRRGERRLGLWGSAQVGFIDSIHLFHKLLPMPKNAIH